MKIDVFAHILPKKYMDALHREFGPNPFKEIHKNLPSLYDMDCRFRVMDKFPGLMQVLTLVSPPIESVPDSKKSADLAKLANDELAELVFRNPDRFAGAAACVPMNDIDAALNEIDRALKGLGLRGIQITTPIQDKALDSPEFFPVYEKMSHYNLPIWIHPERYLDYPDYRTEKQSKYHLQLIFGWVYETSIAMARLVLSGVLDRYPELKIITHHAGAMIPFLSSRIKGCIDHTAGIRKNQTAEHLLRRPLLDYFRMFYADTALYGGTSGLTCSCDFFGADHLLFGTDMPMDSQFGERYTRDTIAAIERMTIDEAAKSRIFEENAIGLLRLPL
jgi:predicted TIM-barrel fold metal-dependent hydrolase